MTLQFGARRAAYYDVTEFIKTEGAPLSPAEMVIAEAGLDGESQVQAIKRYLDALSRK